MIFCLRENSTNTDQMDTKKYQEMKNEKFGAKKGKNPLNIKVL